MAPLAELGWVDVAASLLLVGLAAALAHRRRLRLTRELVTASLRAAVQLVAVGALLLVLFERAGLPGSFGWVLVMVLIAGQVAGRRGEGLPRARQAATAAVAAGAGVTLGALLALGVLATQSRVVVLIGGMIVSSAMQAAGIVLRRLREDAEHARPAIEARLCLGLPAHEAYLPHQRSALRTALLPIVDVTKVVGVINLPGAMTGLILAGVDPLSAVRYQIVVMYMMLAATALAALVAARLVERVLFDRAHRLVPLGDQPA
jgi:putative ABC transport system permease protein